MIDITAVEGEVMTLCTTAYASFKSTATGGIREVVPDSSIPSCDVAAGVPAIEQMAGYETYRLPMTIVLRTKGYKRRTAATALHNLIETIIAGLEHKTGAAFGVIREITGRAGEEPSGDGSTIRTGVVTLVARKF